MGLAASQARFLSITSRKASCEFKSTDLAQQKLELTSQLSSISKDYANAMNATKLMWSNDALDRDYEFSYSMLMMPSAINDYDPYMITTKSGAIVLNDEYAQAAKAAGISKIGGSGSQDQRDKFISYLAHEGLVTEETAKRITKNDYKIKTGEDGLPVINTATGLAEFDLDNVSHTNGSISWDPITGVGGVPKDKSIVDAMQLGDILASPMFGGKNVDWDAFAKTGKTNEYTAQELQNAVDNNLKKYMPNGEITYQTIEFLQKYQGYEYNFTHEDDTYISDWKKYDENTSSFKYPGPDRTLWTTALNNTQWKDVSGKTLVDYLPEANKKWLHDNWGFFQNEDFSNVKSSVAPTNINRVFGSIQVTDTMLDKLNTNSDDAALKQLVKELITDITISEMKKNLASANATKFDYANIHNYWGDPNAEANGALTQLGGPVSVIYNHQALGSGWSHGGELFANMTISDLLLSDVVVMSSDFSYEHRGKEPTEPSMADSITYDAGSRCYYYDGFPYFSENAAQQACTKAWNSYNAQKKVYDMLGEATPEYFNNFGKHVEQLFDSILEVFGYSSTKDLTGVGFNIDEEGARALKVARDLTLKEFSRVYDCKEPSDPNKAKQIVSKNPAYTNALAYNRTTETEDYKAVSLTNMLRTFLTYYDNALRGIDSPYSIAANTAESVYTTDDPNYYYLGQDNEEALDNVTEKSADFFDELYNNLLAHGWTQDSAVDQKEYLESMLKDGRYAMSSLNAGDGYYYQTRYNETGYMVEVADLDAIARAEAEYTAKKAEITYKEDSLDIQTKKLDAEIAALNQEYQSVQQLINNGVQKAFQMFQQ